MAARKNRALALCIVGCTIGTIAHAAPAQLVDVLARSENDYVRELQTRLRDLGYVTAAPNGALGTATLKALMAYCRDAGIIATCATGPVSPPAAAALDQAFAESLGKGSLVLPVKDWTASSKDGLTFAVVPSGDNAAAIHVTGTAEKDGWANVVFSGGVELATLERPRFSVTASAPGGFGGLNAVKAFAASTDADGGYKGELVPAGIDVAEEPSRLDLSGPIPEGASKLVPVVQIQYSAGAKIDATLTIDSPTLRTLKTPATSG